MAAGARSHGTRRDFMFFSLLRLLAVALGVVGNCLARDGATPLRLEHALGSGLLVGVGAIVAYHLVAENVFEAGRQTS